MEEKIKSYLKTKIIANNIKYFENIESTQLMAKKLAEDNIENGTMIIADNQEKGIGTHDRKWYSAVGKNLTFTLIIYPKCNINQLNTITVDIAKSIISAIYDLYKIRLEIKHPNDLMYNGKKVGGILTQIVTNGEIIKYLLIGVGININQEDFCKEITDIATSLKNEFEREFNREKIVAEFCNLFEKYCIDNKII